MRAEALEAASVAARLLQDEAGTFAEIAALFASRKPTIITTAARGSSDHAASFFKYLFEITTGRPVASLGPSIASVYATPLVLPGGVHLTVSQSGASPDIVSLQRAAKDGGAVTIALVNVVDSPLADEADIVLPLHAGEEKSVAATKSCIAALVALGGVTAAVSGRADLAAALQRLPHALADIRTDDASIGPIVAAESLYTTGRGTGFAVALEAALKAKETCGIHAEAFSLAELMHGPMRLVESGFPLIAFLTRDRSYEPSIAALEKLSALGADIQTIGPGSTPWRHIETAATGHALIDPIPALASYYLLIDAVAAARGLDPDQPRNLRKVTQTI